LSEEEITTIKRKGSLVIKDVVPDEQALRWKEDLKAFIAANPSCEGKLLMTGLRRAKLTDSGFQRFACGR